MSSASDRVTAFVTCLSCDTRRKLSIHPDDASDQIRLGCSECREVTVHRTGSPRWFK